MLKRSDEFKRKVSEGCKRNGVGKWMKGRKLSDETKNKIAIASSGRKHTLEAKLKIGLSKKGKKFSEEHRRKLSEAKQGERNNRFGVKHSEETRKKISIAQSGDKNWGWKGDDAKVDAMHTWVEKHKGTPNYCEHFNRIDKKKYEWANIDHTYKRVLEDYIRLCTSCHRKYDIENNGFPNNYLTMQ